MGTDCFLPFGFCGLSLKAPKESDFCALGCGLLCGHENASQKKRIEVRKMERVYSNIF